MVSKRKCVCLVCGDAVMKMDNPCSLLGPQSHGDYIKKVSFKVSKLIAQKLSCAVFSFTEGKKSIWKKVICTFHLTKTKAAMTLEYARQRFWAN